MAGNIYENGLWVSQGQVALVNEQVTEPGQNPAAGAVKQFVAGQVGKKICLTDPSNSGSLIVKEYQYVERDESTSLDGPLFLQWVDPTVDYKVELAGTEGVPAGVFLGDDTATTGQRGVQDGNFGFIQIGGVAECVAGGVIAAGDELTPGTNGQLLSRTVASEALCGVALEAAASTGDLFNVLLNLIRLD